VAEYSTKDLHPRDRINYWIDVATKNFVRHTFQSRAGRSFSGAIRAATLDRLAMARFHCDTCIVTRSPREIARSDSDDVLLCLQLEGKGKFTQDGREVINENGSFLLLDSRRAFAIEFPAQTHSITFKIPRDALAARLGNLTELTCRPITASSAVGGLASGFLSMLPSRVGDVENAAGGKLAEQALDLVALAFASELGGVGAGASSARSNTLFRLKAVIESNLRNPNLKPAGVAAEAGISIRYANALLAQEGSSVERYILYRRLERCRRTLEDASQANRMIGEIAFSWGFSDLSHFARRFRTEYGCAPGDYRRRAQQSAIVADNFLVNE
jgi:AraC family transcriptional regulator, positive regulator of tynA and feaB